MYNINSKEHLGNKIEKKEKSDKKPKNKYKIFFIISLILVSFLAIGWISQIVVYYQLKGEYNQARNQITELEEQVKDLETILDNIDESTDIGLHFMQNIIFDTNYGTEGWNYWIQVPFENYFYFRLYQDHTVQRSSYTTLANSIENFCNASSVYFMAQTVIEVCSDKNDDEEICNAILNLVQDKGNFTPCIHYISEEDDMPKYPIETICEGGGDCEDKSILFVSLLESVGYDTILIIIPGHCFAGVYLAETPTWGDGWYVEYNGKEYYTCETTMEGWRVGDLPSSSQGQEIYVSEVVC
ncbi:MAG: hypothetical protein BAJALOKI2v1_30102 [Promethearchaeota archaeon]|nr:MAG: hypothetical protein BAJALOKI2v1_30102 [Candidatus Lokiarchaeota archaeon]